MRKLLVVILAVIFGLALLSFNFVYTVRYNERAVKTWFGSADQDSVKTEPGLYFKLIYPFHSVTKYDTRVRVLNLKLETQQTADNRQVIVEAFCAWRVDDPLRFFQRFSNAGERAEDHYAKAEEALRANLRSVIALVSRYRLDELFSVGGSAGASASKLAELEQRMLAAFRAAADEQTGLQLADYGVQAVDLGITRILLPEEVTKAVFERMQKARDTLVQETQSQGDARAQAIRAKAEADARRITAFAERLAQNIRVRGDQEAVPYIEQMNSNPQLAVFLENIEFMRDAMAKRTTLVLSGSMPGMSLFDPNALDSLKSGEIPAMRMPGNWLTSAADGGTTDGRSTDARPTGSNTGEQR